MPSGSEALIKKPWGGWWVDRKKLWSAALSESAASADGLYRSVMRVLLEALEIATSGRGLAEQACAVARAHWRDGTNSADDLFAMKVAVWTRIDELGTTAGERAEDHLLHAALCVLDPAPDEQWSGKADGDWEDFPFEPVPEAEKSHCGDIVYFFAEELERSGKAKRTR